MYFSEYFSSNLCIVDSFVVGSETRLARATIYGVGGFHVFELFASSNRSKGVLLVIPIFTIPGIDMFAKQYKYPSVDAITGGDTIDSTGNGVGIGAICSAVSMVTGGGSNEQGTLSLFIVHVSSANNLR